jgi:hypothetical protein
VLADHPRLGPLRSGVCWDAEPGAYVADPLLRAVEPPIAGVQTGSCCELLSFSLMKLMLVLALSVSQVLSSDQCSPAVVRGFDGLSMSG